MTQQNGAPSGRHGVWRLAADIGAAGALVCAFALFHHVLPQRMAVAEPLSTLSVETKLSVDTGSIAAQSGSGALTASVPAAAEQTRVENGAAEAPAQTEGDFSFANVFSAGPVVRTDESYVSQNVSVTLTAVEREDVTYYLQDIFVRNVENLRTAFADDTYGKGIRAYPLEIASANNAICAINGDYYGTSGGNGVVIRNGVLYRDNPTGDVLVLYYDGSMKTFEKTAFHAETEMAAGAYQAWCFGPSLLDENGNAMTGFQSDKRITRSNPRTVIGCYEPGHYCFIAVDGRSSASHGMTLSELSALCESLGLSVAYNLDGGKTSVMTFGGSVVNNPTEGGRESSDIIYICESEVQA